METQLDCIPCIINSYLRLIETDVIPDAHQETLMRKMLDYLAQTDYQKSPPVLGRSLHGMIRESLQKPDPYFQIKQDYNQMMMDQYPSFKDMVDGSKDPFDTAMRMAIAGNVIDFGAKYQFDVMSTLKQIMERELDVDHSRELRQALGKARSLLYIGDNCGEIVMDRLFLETIELPEKVFVVRGSPVINDITMDDAKMTGMDRVARVISTGDNSPGAVWEFASEEFREHFINADVIISKGQGNLEGLLDIPHDHIYFMLVAKCDLIAEKIGVKKGDFVIKKGISE
ncbi:MAG: ARMT1-like domain-containing protein [Bacteroidota bacterium]